MFHNPFNSKIVGDITKFLNEHRNDVQIDPCLHEKAVETAEIIATQGILEDRRNTIVTKFNEAVQECGCRGTNKEANEFAKAVELKLENKTIVVPGKKTSEPSHKDSELAKMGKTIKVPGKKTAEPSHKDSDLAKMGTKIVVPGKKS
jgi:hypothetical protein